MIILMLLLSTTFIAIIIAINIGLDSGNRNTASENLQFLMQREGRPDDIPEVSPGSGDHEPDGTRPDTAPEVNEDGSRPDGSPEVNVNESKTGTSLETDTSDNNRADQQSDDSDISTDGKTTDGSTDSDDRNSNGNTGSNTGSSSNPNPRPPEMRDDSTHTNRPMELATSHFILARFNKDKTLKSIDNTLSDTYSDEDIEAYCEEILAGSKKEGTIDQLRYLVRENKEDIVIAFIDHSSAVQSARNLFLISIGASIFAVAFFALLSYVLSGWMVRPVEEAFTKQKQFISDASHELKTPITVILSNSELLEDQIGENKQLSYIKKECDQMHYLVTSLLTLTRLEQTPYKDVEKNDFCISDTLLERILPMESVAFEKGVLMDYENVTPDLHCYGVKEQIGQVAAILIDNAITHTDKGGNITIALWKTPHHIHMTVANTGKEIPVEERERLFERFYRADESRHRASGHFGLGLSIAKTIVTNHKGKISVDCADGITTFTVKLKTVEK